MLQGKVILAVDDEPDVLETIVEVLEMCRVDTAGSYEQAYRLLERRSYDMVVLDVMGVRGLQLLEHAVNGKFPAVMLTAPALHPEYVLKSMERGAISYMPKEDLARLDCLWQTCSQFWSEVSPPGPMPWNGSSLCSTSSLSPVGGSGTESFTNSGRHSGIEDVDCSALHVFCCFFYALGECGVRVHGEGEIVHVRRGGDCQASFRDEIGSVGSHDVNPVDRSRACVRNHLGESERLGTQRQGTSRGLERKRSDFDGYLTLVCLTLGHTHARDFRIGEYDRRNLDPLEGSGLTRYDFCSHLPLVRRLVREHGAFHHVTDRVDAGNRCLHA